LRIPLKETYNIIMGIVEDASIVKVPVSVEDIREAMKKSVETGIHIWDFLCFLPAKGH